MAHGQASSSVISVDERSALAELARDLGAFFGDRLLSLVVYGERDADGVHTLGLVEGLAFADLAKCAPRVPVWHRLGLATPLFLTRHEFRRTLDVFPVEYGEIIARHEVIAGRDPFEGLVVDDADLRRGCEQLAKSLLIHLREGFLETSGVPRAVAGLMAASAPALRRLMINLERLEPGTAAAAGITPELMREVESADQTTIEDPSLRFGRCVAVVERLWQYVDAWRP